MQQVYDAIKRVRLGETVDVEIQGKLYSVRPMEYQGQDGYCSTVFCKLRGRIRIAMICWKDAGPNPKLVGSRYFINRNDLYGIATEKPHVAI